MLAVITGVVFLLARLVRIGWMADYLSQAVLVGYIAGVAIVLIIGQIGKLTGHPVGGRQRPAGAAGATSPTSRPSTAATLAVGLAAMVVLVLHAPGASRRWPSALMVVVLGIAAAW